MTPRAALLCLLVGVLLPAQDLRKLPDWAQALAKDGIQAKPPDGADAWVLLDRTEFAYTGDGEIRQKRYRLVRILTERGLDQGQFVLSGLGGRGNKVKRLKGWNCRPDGEVTRIDKDEVLTLDADGDDEVTTVTRTVAMLDRPMKGSLIAFESQQVLRTVSGPGGSSWPMQEHPVRSWELLLGKDEGWFGNLKQVGMELQTRNFKPWLGLDDFKEGSAVQLKDVPPWPKHEQAVPSGRDVLPRVVIRFKDPQLKEAAPLESWNAMAAWYCARYLEKGLALKVHEGGSQEVEAGLRAIHRWISSQTTYKMVYLAPERGWIPEVSLEVRRKRYGDCKDLSCLLAGAARGLGLEAYPVLARIAVGSIAEDEPIANDAFNHVIAAIRLPRSLGLPAEVDTPQGRFLLADSTSRFTPFGSLPDSHHGGRVLICLPTGGVWVKIPDSALHRPTIAYSLAGKLEISGRLKGSLLITEEGDFQGFRSAAAGGGGKAIKERVAAQIDLPLGVVWDAQVKGDPWNLAVPLQVHITLDHPTALEHLGSDFVLTPLGMPRAPEPIQKSGQARRYPVERPGLSRWSFDVDLQLPTPSYRPLIPSQRVETPFRTWSLDSEVRDGAWKLHYQQTRRDARYGFDRREEGVKAAKQDRNQYRIVLEEGLALRPGP
jgi:hypothetical protein